MDFKLSPQKKWEIRNRKNCIDCNILISPKGLRCRKCAVKKRNNDYCANNLKHFKNENHPMWKGNNVGYQALHDWIRVNKIKPEFCEICNKNKPIDLANISGKYKRDIKDYIYLCRKCHHKFDDKPIPKRDKKGKFIKNDKNII